MTDRDGLDLLDLRLVGYLRERAEMAAAYGPGPDAVAASVAGAGTRPAPSRSTARGMAALAWIALALVALVLVAFAASLAGSEQRDRSLVVPASLPPASGQALIGRWDLDFAASGIDDAYGGSPRPDGLTFSTTLTFRVVNRLELWSGAGGGCPIGGAWTVTDDRIAIDVSTGVRSCEDSIGPAPREIRLRLERARTFEISGDRLILRDDAGADLLTFRGPPGEVTLGPLQLDFEASGIPGYYTIAMQKIQRVPVGSWIELLDRNIDGGTGAAGGCDSFSGLVARDGQAISISVPVAEGHCGHEQPDLAVRQRLDRAASFAIVGDTFRLYDAEGAQLLVYRAMESATPAP
jgi:hypothetical protein